jgi:two-component system, NtrC family, sensor histidine kinase KinB
MVLKTKLSWGLGFLFAIIFALVTFSSYHIQRLSVESGNILKDNYDSITYAEKMFYALDDMNIAAIGILRNESREENQRKFESGKAEFEKDLKAENSNITEVNEKEYVETLKTDYTVFLGVYNEIVKTGGTKDRLFAELTPVYEKMRHSINNIDEVNMQAVSRKSQLTIKDSANIVHIMVVIGTLSVLLAFAYLWYFPVYISTTLSYLSDKMRGLLKNLDIVSDMKTTDESLIILESINLIEKKLGIVENDSHENG